LVRPARTAPELGQSRVDQLLQAIRSGTALPVEAEAPRPSPVDARQVEQSIAAELARVKRMLDAVSEELTDDVEVLMRHERAMQSFDIAAMIVEELARVMAAHDRVAPSTPSRCTIFAAGSRAGPR
jgi:hypothetical protein